MDGAVLADQILADDLAAPPLSLIPWQKFFDQAIELTRCQRVWIASGAMFLGNNG
jgi:hypothetical protein